MAQHEDLEKPANNTDIVRDVPEEINRRFAVAQILLDLAHETAQDASHEARIFLEKAGEADGDNPFVNCTPEVERLLGNIIIAPHDIQYGLTHARRYAGSSPSTTDHSDRAAIQSLLKDLLTTE